MDAMRVHPVAGSRELNTWIRFPREHVYGDSSPWVPPLDRDLRRALNRHENPFFRYGDALALLATDQAGRPVGRLLAHVYHRHNLRHLERAAFFGYFESLDNQAACDALFAAAADFARGYDCTVLRGPFNMTAMQEMGTLVEGFNEPPAVDETYTAPYYATLLERTGLHRTFPHVTFRVDDLAQVDPEGLLAERHHALMGEGTLRIRSANLKDWDYEIETLRELLNDSFYDNPHFVPITREEFIFQIGPYRRLMAPELSLVAELHGVPCGFVITVPDFNPLLKRMNGSMSPRSLFTFLRGQSKVRNACLIIMGVQRQLQGRGIMRILHAELIRALRRLHYRTLTVTWIAESNAKSRAAVAALGSHPLHQLTLYEAPIPLTKSEFSA
jgi:GNAT superfamily N-acetyltransferase